MIKPANTTEKAGNYALEHLHKNLKGFKAPYLGVPVKAGTEHIDHIALVGNKEYLRVHMQNLEKYLEKHPGDIEIRLQLAGLKELLK